MESSWFTYPTFAIEPTSFSSTEMPVQFFLDASIFVSVPFVSTFWVFPLACTRRSSLAATSFFEIADTALTADLKRQLTAYTAKYPQCCCQIDDDEQGGLTFEIEKGRLSFRLTAPYSEKRK